MSTNKRSNPYADEDTPETKIQKLEDKLAEQKSEADALRAEFNEKFIYFLNTSSKDKVKRKSAKIEIEHLKKKLDQERKITEAQKKTLVNNKKLIALLKCDKLRDDIATTIELLKDAEGYF